MFGRLARIILLRLTGYTPMTDARHAAILAAIDEDAALLAR